MLAQTPPALQMIGITKRFPGGVVANEAVNLTAASGSIHAIIGENGAGKSTAMNILYARILPDSGRILIGGEEPRLQTPADAIHHGIGMVTQHTTMIAALSVEENITLGCESVRLGLLDRRASRRRIQELCDRLSIDIDPASPAGELSVAALQKAEIIKALYRGARVLILDEPTACLAPQESDALFRVMHELSNHGSTVLLVTHKLREVMAHCSAVTVLRKGRTVLEANTSGTTIGDLVSAMMPDQSQVEAGDAPPPSRTAGLPALAISGLSTRPRERGVALRGLSLDVACGEVVGVAGVDGSGQQELADAIVGTRRADSGSIRLCEVDCSTMPVAARLAHGLAYIPQDRHREGIVLDFPIWENLLLGRHHDRAAGGGPLLSVRRARAAANEAISDHDIRAGGIDDPAGSLSGGNQQKLLMARATSVRPRLVVAMQPTRGLDIGASRAAHGRLKAMAAAGAGVLLFSLDLDELIEVSDRIAVMYQGAIVADMAGGDATAEILGEWMLTGHTQQVPPQ